MADEKVPLDVYDDYVCPINHTQREMKTDEDECIRKRYNWYPNFTNVRILHIYTIDNEITYGCEEKSTLQNATPIVYQLRSDNSISLGRLSTIYLHYIEKKLDEIKISHDIIDEKTKKTYEGELDAVIKKAERTIKNGHRDGSPIYYVQEFDRILDNSVHIARQTAVKLLARIKKLFIFDQESEYCCMDNEDITPIMRQKQFVMFKSSIDQLLDAEQHSNRNADHLRDGHGNLIGKKYPDIDVNNADRMIALRYGDEKNPLHITQVLRDCFNPVFSAEGEAYLKEISGKLLSGNTLLRKKDLLDLKILGKILLLVFAFALSSYAFSQSEQTTSTVITYSGVCFALFISAITFVKDYYKDIKEKCKGLQPFAYRGSLTKKGCFRLLGYYIVRLPLFICAFFGQPQCCCKIYPAKLTSRKDDTCGKFSDEASRILCCDAGADVNDWDDVDKFV